MTHPRFNPVNRPAALLPAPGPRPVWFLLVILLVFLSGCAARRPGTLPVAEAERERVATAFAAMRAGWRQCGCCLDAEVDLRLVASPWFGERLVAMSGYLQTVSPHGARFVGVNPLGQPLVILALAGERFFLVLPAEALFYEGGLGVAAVARYLPLASLAGPQVEWLFGRLPEAGFEMRDITREPESQGYWIELQWRESDYASRVLFDPEAGLIRRHQVSRGDTLLVDLGFTEFRPADRAGAALAPGDLDPCPRPGRVSGFFRTHEINAELVFNTMTTGVRFEPRTFVIEPPAGYERRQIK